MDPSLPFSPSDCREYRIQLLAESFWHVEQARALVLSSTNEEDVRKWADEMNGLLNRLEGVMRIVYPLSGEQHQTIL